MSDNTKLAKNPGFNSDDHKSHETSVKRCKILFPFAIIHKCGAKHLPQIMDQRKASCCRNYALPPKKIINTVCNVYLLVRANRNCFIQFY